MHPDEATEPIIDTALEYEAFAVVPCCVFAREAALRGVSAAPTGEEVTTYEHLVEYLIAKDARIQRSFLGFKGRNIVLYFRGGGSGNGGGGGGSGSHAHNLVVPG